MIFCGGFWFGFGVFPTCLLWWGICLFVWIFASFGFSLVWGVFVIFLLFKISFIASSTSWLWNMPYQFSTPMGVMLLLQLTAGFQTAHVSQMVTSWSIELLQLGEDAWFLSSIIFTPFSCKVLIHRWKPCLRQILKGMVLILVNLWNCFIVSLCVIVSTIWEVEKNAYEKNTFP